MSDIARQLRDYATEDHDRGCHGREYSCLCGYDDQRDPLLVEAADEITRLRGAHKALVLQNAVLRQRPDLPLNRIPAARAVASLYEENDRLRAALRQIAACKTFSNPAYMIVIAQAAMEGKE